MILDGLVPLSASTSSVASAKVRAHSSILSSRRRHIRARDSKHMSTSDPPFTDIFEVIARAYKVLATRAQSIFKNVHDLLNCLENTPFSDYIFFFNAFFLMALRALDKGPEGVSSV